MRWAETASETPMTVGIEARRGMKRTIVSRLLFWVLLGCIILEKPREVTERKKERKGVWNGLVFPFYLFFVL